MREESKEAHIALEAWARWANSVFQGLGYSSANIIARLIEMGAMGAAQQSRGPAPMEIDQTCEIVDRAVMRLDSTEREVICRTYLQNDAAMVTAQKCGLTYGYYREVLAKARQRVADYMSGVKSGVVFPTTRLAV